MTRAEREGELIREAWRIRAADLEWYDDMMTRERVVLVRLDDGTEVRGRLALDLFRGDCRVAYAAKSLEQLRLKVAAAAAAASGEPHLADSPDVFMRGLISP